MNSLELFSGTGGLALGLHRAGMHHLALYEWDKDACANLRQNSQLAGLGWNVVEGDVRDVDFSPYRGVVDVVAGGPPCQPFSMGGKGLAHDDHRDMFPEAVRAIREVRPKAFVFENVKGLLRKAFSNYFNYILLQLSHPDVVKKEGQEWESHMGDLERRHTSRIIDGEGYNVVYRLVDVADYGVPQNRYRVVIVGFRNDIHAGWQFPEATHSRDMLMYEKWITGNYWEEHAIKKPEEPFLSSSQKRRLSESCDVLMPLQRWQTVRDVITGLTYSEQESFRPAKPYPGHSGSRLDEPSKTIKAGAHGVPGGENMLVMDDGSCRYYTVRESARIQTFPDEFRFGSSWTESMRQIGNAVPVRLGEIIGQSIVSHLAI